MAQPLTSLLKNAFKWSTEAEKAWNKLKQTVVTTPVLALPDFSEIFVVESDVSSGGLGVVLSQKGRPITFFSKALSQKNQALSVYEKEMLAIFFAVKKWSSYLVGRHFKIKTNHNSLRFYWIKRQTL